MGPNKPKGCGYCKPCAAAKSREYRAKHPEKAAVAKAKWESAHPGRARELRVTRHSNGGVERHQRYYAANRERISAYWRSWCAANRPKVSAWNHEARARRSGATGSHTVAEWKSVLRHFKRLCVYCGVKLTTKNISKDHDVPLKRLGSNSIRNIVPACRRCNSRKHTMTGAEFRKHLETKS